MCMGGKDLLKRLGRDRYFLLEQLSDIEVVLVIICHVI